MIRNRKVQKGVGRIPAILATAISLPFILIVILGPGAAREPDSPPLRPSSLRLAMMHDRGSGAMMDHMMGGGMRRHMYYMRNGVPAAYAGKRNPLRPTAAILQAGAKLYQENCASCHGPRGLGDGEGGRGLRPRPANLARMINMPMLTDPYLLWTIFDGGEPIGSAMPAFKDVLSEEEVWKIIAAMRGGFPRPK